MKMRLPFVLIGLVFSLQVEAQTNLAHPTGTSGQTLETIVCIRHAEKPGGELGQLTCRGLNRALALPKVLLKKYGTPQYIFAPNPTQKADAKNGKGGQHHVRPLLTIQPTATRCGLPVNTQFGFREIKGLESELQKHEYQNATVFIAWEHGLLDEFAKNLVKHNGGDPALVPSWPKDEYDMIFVFKISTEGGHKTISFAVDREGLNGLSDTRP